MSCLLGQKHSAYFYATTVVLLLFLKFISLYLSIADTTEASNDKSSIVTVAGGEKIEAPTVLSKCLFYDYSGISVIWRKHIIVFSVCRRRFALISVLYYSMAHS